MNSPGRQAIKIPGPFEPGIFDYLVVEDFAVCQSRGGGFRLSNFLSRYRSRGGGGECPVV